MDNGGNDEDDAHLWAYIVRDVTPIDGKKPCLDDDVARAKKGAGVPRKERFADVDSFGALPFGREVEVRAKQGSEMDRRTAQRFARGQMPIDGRLDLHGMNQGEAREALVTFVEAAYRSGKRKLLVITGKGRTKSAEAEHYGVLKARVPDWLREPVVAPMVLRVMEARPEHGGGGALYVLLRRDR